MQWKLTARCDTSNTIANIVINMHLVQPVNPINFSEALHEISSSIDTIAK